MTRLTARMLDQLARVRGLRLTPQRRAIVDFLAQAEHHPTAEEVYQAVNRRFPMTSRATVYNTLHLLRGSGLLKELTEAGLVRFDPNVSPHHHFICRRCGRVEDVDWDRVGPVTIGRLPGKQLIDGFEVTLRGLCGACREG